MTKKVKSEKMVGSVKKIDHCRHKFNFGRFFSSPVKLIKGLNLKITPKFNHGFTNHGYLHNAFHSFKVQLAQKAKKIISFPYKMFEMRFL